MYHDPLTLNKYNQTSKIFLIIVMRKHSHFLTKILEAFLTAYQMPLIKIPNETSQEKFNISQIIMKCHKCLHRFPFKSGRIPNESKKQYCSNYFSFLTCDQVLLKLTSFVCVCLFPSYYPLWQQNKKNGKYFNKYMSTLNPINFNDIVVKYH